MVEEGDCEGLEIHQRMNPGRGTRDEGREYQMKIQCNEMTGGILCDLKILMYGNVLLD